MCIRDRSICGNENVVAEMSAAVSSGFLKQACRKFGWLPIVRARKAAPLLTCARMIRTLQKWGEFVKISHTVFALPFALASMAIAAREDRGWPGVTKFLLILAAMVCARTCA